MQTSLSQRKHMPKLSMTDLTAWFQKINPFSDTKALRQMNVSELEHLLTVAMNYQEWTVTVQMNESYYSEIVYNVTGHIVEDLEGRLYVRDLDGKEQHELYPTLLRHIYFN